MKKNKNTTMYLLFIAIAILTASLIVGCDNIANPTSPTVSSTYPVDAATDRAINSTVTATFSEEMDSATMIGTNFTLTDGTTPVVGNVTYDIPNKLVTFVPAVNLVVNTTYTATVTTGVTNLTGNALAVNKVWTFTTEAAGLGPAPVQLGTAGNFVILAKTGISTVPASVITGNIGISPAAQSLITGFSQTDAIGYSTSPQITGFIYASDMAPPTPSNMTTAIADMLLAYTDAAGRVTPDFTDLLTGAIGGETLAPGLYKWNSAVTIPTDITISGNANDVWIFQISGNLTVSNAVQVTLSGGAKARNIFWQLSGAATLEANSHFEGIILSQTAIAMGNGASINGRLLAQSEVTLNQNTVTKPAL